MSHASLDLVDTNVSIKVKDRDYVDTFALRADYASRLLLRFDDKTPISIHITSSTQRSKQNIEDTSFLFSTALETIVRLLDILRETLQKYSPDDGNKVINDIFHGTSTLTQYTHVCKSIIHELRQKFRVVLTRELLDFMFEDEFMRAVGGHCNEDITCIYYLLAVVIESKHQKSPSSESSSSLIYTLAVVDILKYIGDDGCYVWLHLLNENGCKLTMCASLMEYCAYNSSLAVYCLTQLYKSEYPTYYAIGMNSNQRQRTN